MKKMTQNKNQKAGKNRANFGLKPKDMTPAQRKNWERVIKRKK